MKDEEKNKINNQSKYRSLSFLLKKKYINNANQDIINNLPPKIQLLMPNNKPSQKRKVDTIFLNTNIGFKMNTINKVQKDIFKKRQSIGINTSEHQDTKKNTSISDNQKDKSNNKYMTKPYSELFKKYIISYDKNIINNNKNNDDSNYQKRLKKIRQLKLKKSSNTIHAFPIKRTNKNDINKSIKVQKEKGPSLLTYNFNKDTYSIEQKLLININNNILFSPENRKRKNLKNYLNLNKTAKNFKTMIYSNEDIKSMSHKKKIKKQKLFKKTNLFHDNPNQIPMDHSINKDIKISLCNSLIKALLSNDNNKYNKAENRNKMPKNEEILKLMEYPDSVFNYIIHKLGEYNIIQNKRNGFKIKLENIKNDLKLTEQKALYELINLRYDRVPGNEINIRTNLFCVKNKIN